MAVQNAQNRKEKGIDELSNLCSEKIKYTNKCCFLILFCSLWIRQSHEQTHIRNKQTNEQTDELLKLQRNRTVKDEQNINKQTNG